MLLGSRVRTAIDGAMRDSDVYLERSGIPMHSKIREAVERVGPDRVLHGSATSSHHPTLELAKVRVSDLWSNQATGVSERMAAGCSLAR